MALAQAQRLLVISVHVYLVSMAHDANSIIDLVNQLLAGIMVSLFSSSTQ
jgi:hypothetical protein